MLDIAEVEQAIYDHYQFFAQVAPGTEVRESGGLAQLWRAFDMLISEP